MIWHVRHRVPALTIGTVALVVPAMVLCSGPSATGLADRPSVSPGTHAAGTSNREPAAAAPTSAARTTPSKAAPSRAAESRTLAAALQTATPVPPTRAPSATSSKSSAKSIASPAPRATAAPQAATVKATSVGRIPVTQLKLMNYTPAKAPWLAMWQRYNHAQINSDFAAIRSLGANAVRIAIDPSAVGFPTLNATGADNLTDIVATAKANGLAVQFTLFDWYSPYSQVANSITWLRSALSRFAGDPSIALVEVKNEIDVNNSAVLAWTKSVLAALPSILPGVPRTVSVGGVQDLAAMRRLTTAIPQSDLDVIDSHLYGIDAVVGAKLAAAQAVANGRPIFVGEMGRPTAAAASGCADNDQAAFYTWMQTMLAKANITGFAPWTYTDLDPRYLPAEYVGTPEANYGLRRLDGSWKPAAAIVRTMFGTGGGRANLVAVSSQVEPYQYFDGGFECTASRTPSSSTVSGSDGWATFDASQVQLAGTAAKQGVNGSTAGMLSNTRGDYKGAIPSLMRSFALVGTGAVSVTADVRLVRGTGYTTVALAWFAGTRYLGGTQATPASNAGTGWQQVSITGQPPAGADTLQIHLKSYANTGTAYFDDVQIINPDSIPAGPTAAGAGGAVGNRSTVHPK